MVNKVGIIGMGALGILYGDLLTKGLGKENVGFILDDKRQLKYEKDGVYCNNELCDFKIINYKNHEPLDLIILSVKATALNESIEIIKPFVKEGTIIISLLNGVISEEKLIDVFGLDKVIYCVAQGMDAVKLENKLSYISKGFLFVGITEESMKPKLDSLIETFEKCLIPYVVEENILRRIWSKFMFNVGINQVVMVSEGTYEIVQKEGKERQLMIKAMQEAMAVSNAKGIDLNENDLNQYLKVCDSLDPSSMPSMRQDGLAKRKTEKDLFSKTVIELGDMYNIETPINDELYKLISEIEANYYND